MGLSFIGLGWGYARGARMGACRADFNAGRRKLHRAGDKGGEYTGLGQFYGDHSQILQPFNPILNRVTRLNPLECLPFLGASPDIIPQLYLRQIRYHRKLK